MFTQTTYEEFQSMAESARRNGKSVVAITREILGDFITPVAAYEILANKYQGSSALLESVSSGRHRARYSIIAASPFLQFTVKEGLAESKKINPFASPDCWKTESSHDPLGLLEKVLKSHSPEKKCPFFTGGAIGYIGHEATSLIETSVPRHRVNDLDLPDIFLQFYRAILVFDLHTQSLHLVQNVDVGAWGSREYASAIDEIDAVERELKQTQRSLPELKGFQLTPSSNVSEEEFYGMVRKAKERISAGDIFQVVLSRRFETHFSGKSIDLYRLLRRENPSPYLFHLNLKSVERPNICLIGASPEVMVRISCGEILIRPLAGTRKRGSNQTEDLALAADLASDPKEQAEHRMLVDLARNDVGRYCKSDSIKVEGLMRVEPYGRVLHMVTDVSGVLQPKIHSTRALLGCLPAGTLSGAPKIRALQIIAELEPCSRGPYGGAVGWLTDTETDTCIMIRSMLVYREKLYWQAGAGIVTDSIPYREWEEINAKADATMRVLTKLSEEKI